MHKLLLDFGRNCHVFFLSAWKLLLKQFVEQNLENFVGKMLFPCLFKQIFEIILDNRWDAAS